MRASVKFPAAVLLATMLAGAVSAETVRFRSGRVLSAELSDQAPEIVPGNEYTALELPTSRVYAAVTVKLDSGRNLSIYDYRLKTFGVTFPCVAIRSEGGKFSDAEWKIDPADPTKKYTLLFIVDGKQLNRGSGDETMTLISALSENNPLAETTLNFRRIGSRALTPPESVPERGTFPEEKTK